MSYDVIIADPAWSFDDKIKGEVKRGADAHYGTMTISDIKALPVAQVASEDSVLALWVPSSMLQEGLDVMTAWGFAHKQTYIWAKTSKKPGSGTVMSRTGRKFKRTRLPGLAFGMGRLFRNCHEIALIGTRGSVYKWLDSRSERTVTFAPNMGHSVKPEDLHRSLERMFPGSRRLELFARRPVDGWTCLGNEIDGRDLLDSLAALVA